MHDTELKVAARNMRSNEKVHASKLMSNLQINASVRTVQRHMRRNGYIYKKAKRNIELHDLHKEKRINECRIWIASNHNWERTIFSDEKRFCCDGPDNWNSYCQKGQYLRRQRRQCSGGSVMVWIMVLPSGLLSHHILQGTFTSQKYVDLLRRYVVPVIKLNYKSPIYFQQDNSSVHKAKMVTQFFNSNTIPLISWPSRSPDLNIAENVWKLISEQVYDGPQFQNKNDLVSKINCVINDINCNQRNKIKQLYCGIRSRLCSVLQNQGDIINK